jgi:AcrR family transcriptional regulator
MYSQFFVAVDTQKRNDTHRFEMGRASTKTSRGGARAGAGRPRAADADSAILDAALALFEKNGYAGLSIDAVAAAAGVAKTTIYRRWASKAMLLSAAAAPLYAQFLTSPDSGCLRDDLIDLLTRGRELMTGRAGRILQMLIRASAEHGEMVEPLQAALYRRRRLYHVVLNRAIARGELRDDLDQDLLVDLLLGPFWVRTMVTPSPIPLELVPTTVDAVLDGVRRRS